MSNRSKKEEIVKNFIKHLINDVFIEDLKKIYNVKLLKLAVKDLEQTEPFKFIYRGEDLLSSEFMEKRLTTAFSEKLIKEFTLIQNGLAEAINKELDNYIDFINEYNSEKWTCYKMPVQSIPFERRNLRLEMGDSAWNALSKKVRSEADYVCAYCGERHPEKYGTNAHEEWQYIILKQAKEIHVWLRDIKCVCRECHDIVHPGVSSLYRTINTRKFMEVNSTDMSHKIAALADYQLKNMLPELEKEGYKVIFDYGKYKPVQMVNF